MCKIQLTKMMWVMNKTKHNQEKFIFRINSKFFILTFNFYIFWSHLIWFLCIIHWLIDLLSVFPSWYWNSMKMEIFICLIQKSDWYWMNQYTITYKLIIVLFYTTAIYLLPLHLWISEGLLMIYLVSALSFLFIKRKLILFTVLMYAEKYLNISASLQKYEQMPYFWPIVGAKFQVNIFKRSRPYDTSHVFFLSSMLFRLVYSREPIYIEAGRWGAWRQ